MSHFFYLLFITYYCVLHWVGPQELLKEWMSLCIAHDGVYGLRFEVWAIIWLTLICKNPEGSGLRAHSTREDLIFLTKCHRVLPMDPSVWSYWTTWIANIQTPNMSEDKTVIILRRNFCPSRDDAKLLTLADEFFSPGLFFYWACHSLRVLTLCWWGRSTLATAQRASPFFKWPSEP